MWDYQWEPDLNRMSRSQLRQLIYGFDNPSDNDGERASKMVPFQAKWQFAFLRLHAKIEMAESKVFGPIGRLLDSNTRGFIEKTKIGGKLRLVK